MAFRFTFIYPAGVRKKDIVCPNCGYKEFTPYWDLVENEINTDFGRCNRRDKCGFKREPKRGEVPFSQKRERHPQAIFAPKSEISVTVCEPRFEPSNEKLFTVIKNTQTARPKALKHLDIFELIDLLNTTKVGAGKHEQTAILKGIYPIGGFTNGEYCQKSTGILFYDIDKTNNDFLQVQEKRAALVDFLRRCSLFVASSFSGIGVFGALYVPELANMGNSAKDEHKRAGDAITAYLEGLIQKHLGFGVEFDRQQNAFRQIRYLAAQSEKVTPNFNVKQFRIW